MRTSARAYVLICCMWSSALGADPVPEDPSVYFERGRALLESRRADQAEIAMHELQRALEGFEAAEGRDAERAETLYALALAAELAGDPVAALELNQRAIRIFERLADPFGVAAAHDHRASLLIHQGRLEPAQSHFRRALEARRRIGDPSAIATSLHNLASLELEAGRGGAALDLFQQSLDLRDGLGEPEARAAGLNNLGLLWLHLGRNDSGRRFLESALEQHRRTGDRLSEAGTLNNLAWTAWQDRRWPEARDRLIAALEIYSAFGHRAGIARILGNLGLVDLEQGDLPSARRRIEAAIAEARDQGFQRIEASHLASLGRWQLMADTPEQAIATLGRAAARQRELNDPESLSISLFDLAQAHRRRGELTAALAALDESIEAMESMGSRLGGGDMRAYFLAPRRRLYDLRIDLLMQQRKWSEALLTSERARARGLLDLLAFEPRETARRLTSESAEPLSLKRARDLIDDRTAALILHLGEEKAWAWVMTQEELSAFELGSAGTLDQLAADTRAAVADSRRRLARGLAQRSLEKLADALADPLARMKQRRWLIVPDGALHGTPFAALPLSDGRSAISRHDVVTLPSLTVLARLRDRRHTDLQEPQTSGVGDSAGELAVLADPVFHRRDTRFQAVGSASDLGSDSSRGTQTPTLSSFGPALLELPRLPFSAVEAERISRYFPPDRVEVHTGFNATAELVTGGALKAYRRLHFATHAIVDDQHPERSGLALSAIDARGRPVGKGFLRLADIFELRLDAELVTLSACRSALGKPLRGEGLLGLSRGFFSAGARRLVAGLWDVDDRAAVELMASFYQLSAEDGLDPAAALAEAQRRLRDDPRWSAPFYWAGFVLLGDWR